MNASHLLGLAVAVGLVACTDRSMDPEVADGKNVGTEAGNAVAARILNQDGSPRIGAEVIARPADAEDSGSIGRWRRVRSDTDGWARLELDSSQAWTLEILHDSLAARIEIGAHRSWVVDSTRLAPSVGLHGQLARWTEGERIGLPGLGRGTIVDSIGRFHLGRIPRASTPVRTRAGIQTIVAPTDSAILIGQTVGADRTIAYQSLAAASMVRHFVLPNDSLPGPSPSLLDAAFAPIGSLVGPNRGGYRHVWIGASATPPATWIAHPGLAPTPFLGNLTAWIPDLSHLPLAGPSITPDSISEFRTDSAEGLVMGAPLGLPLAHWRRSGLPPLGDFTVAVRMRLTSPEFGSLWLLDLPDTSGAPLLRLGLGAGLAHLIIPGADTTVSMPQDSRFHSMVVIHQSGRLSVWMDGTVILAVEGFPLKRAWSDGLLGSRGGMEVASLLTWEGSLDGTLVCQAIAPSR